MDPRDNDKLRLGFLDQQGNWVIQPQYTEAREFSEGLAAVRSEDQRWSFIDKTGKSSVSPEANLTDAMRFTEGLAAAQVKDDSEDQKSGLSGSVFPVWGEHIACQEMGRKWGFIDKSGKFVIQPKYDSVGEFHDGLAPVLINKKWGFIAPDKTAIDARFDKASVFSNGLAAVRQDNKFGYIDKGGAIKIPFNFDKASDFVDGFAVVQEGKVSLVIDLTGTVVAKDFDRHQLSKSGLFSSYGPGLNPRFDSKTKTFLVSAAGPYIVFKSRDPFGPRVPVAYMDKAGAIKIEAKLPNIPKDALVMMDDFQGEYAIISIHSGDLMSEYYICDKTGKTVKANASQVFGFSEGLARFFAEPGKN